MTLVYQPRDGKGNDIEKQVQVKEFQPEAVALLCPCCHRQVEQSVQVKKIVSANFTDWNIVGDRVCPDCAALFSLYFYSYIVDPDGIRLLNVRQLRDALTQRQKPPFLFVITTSQKKHLFYRAVWNYAADRFAVNLETETIYTTPERMRILFDFVESLQTLGCTKERLKAGEIGLAAFDQVDHSALAYLRHELVTSREIQIPLYCGQRRETEGEAICCINSIVTTWKEHGRP